jgi:1-phosphatidylinositol phosphodiesterase
MSTSSTKIETNKWMTSLDDEIHLSELSLPGTHNSCANNCNYFSKCQFMSLEDQLNAGVRYLDIRCRHVKDNFIIHHGITNIGKKFIEDVLVPTTKFLIQNPREAVLMQVKPEYKDHKNTESFDQTFLKSIEQYKDFWYLEDDLPTLKEVRGKIVLCRRFAVKKMFIFL